jgi:hypothetical protein
MIIGLILILDLKVILISKIMILMDKEVFISLKIVFPKATLILLKSSGKD